MSKSRSSRRVPFSVRASDATTEVFVIDNQLRRIAGGVGHVALDASPGVYKIRLRSGSTQRDHLVEVTPESIRLRKKHLKESDRRRAARSA